MTTNERTAALHSGAMGQDQAPSNPLDLPRELLDHILSFLPLCSIPRLMVNKKLRVVCEQYLYRFIRLVGHPQRSLRLLNTLTQRPDLALLIRDFRISLKRCPETVTKSTLPNILQPDGLAPFSPVRNIRYLHIGGLNWLSDPSLDNIRRIVSIMQLNSLVIEYWQRGRAQTDEEADQRVISHLRAILQSQPQLEFLFLTLYSVQPSRLNSIEVVDVPNLRSFKAKAPYVGPILNTAPNLRKLDLDFGFGGLAYKSLGVERWNGHKIRDLAISVSFKSVSNWDEFESLLARFPNTESLYLRSTTFVYSSMLWSYLENVSQNTSESSHGILTWRLGDSAESLSSLPASARCLCSESSKSAI